METICLKSDKRKQPNMAVSFDRAGAFLRINTDVFGNLNPKAIKQGISAAIDLYYQRINKDDNNGIQDEHS